MNTQNSTQLQAADTSQMTVLSLDATDQVGGGRIPTCPFDIGWAIGTYIDQTFIKPLWNN